MLTIPIRSANKTCIRKGNPISSVAPGIVSTLVASSKLGGTAPSMLGDDAAASSMIGNGGSEAGRLDSVSGLSPWTRRSRTEKIIYSGRRVRRMPVGAVNECVIYLRRQLPHQQIPSSSNHRIALPKPSLRPLFWLTICCHTPLTIWSNVNSSK